jgi:hypothetical protein
MQSQQYNFLPLVHNGHIHVESCRGMYGLPQGGCLTNDQLIKVFGTTWLLPGCFNTRIMLAQILQHHF